MSAAAAVVAGEGIGYLGPEGTFSHEALLGTGVDAAAIVAFPTIFDTVMAVHDGRVARALVPIENSIEGSVNQTLDALATEATDVRITGELVHRVRNQLIAGRELELPEITRVLSHPQAMAQCARFLREHLPGAQVLPEHSTADAVRTVVGSDEPWAALGTRLGAERYGGVILREDVEDAVANDTRFAWLERLPGTVAGEHGSGDAVREGDGTTWKTSVVFWGAGDDAPGWLVRCLSEFAFRGVNLTLIESRPQKLALGHYMFFADLDGGVHEDHVAKAIAAVGRQTEVLRVLGSYPAAS